jgi:hypothetical protein
MQLCLFVLVFGFSILKFKYTTCRIQIVVVVVHGGVGLYWFEIFGSPCLNI